MVLAKQRNARREILIVTVLVIVVVYTLQYHGRFQHSAEQQIAQEHLTFQPPSVHDDVVVKSNGAHDGSHDGAHGGAHGGLGDRKKTDDLKSNDAHSLGAETQRHDMIASTAKQGLGPSSSFACSPAQHDSLLDVVPETSAPVRVGLMYAKRLEGETFHFFYDGIRQSQYLKLEFLCQLSNTTTCSMNHILNATTVQVWAIPLSESYKDHHIRKIQKVIDLSVERAWHVLFFDYSDHLKPQFPQTFQLGNVSNRSKLRRVRVAVRAIVTGRYFDRTTSLLTRGKVDATPVQRLVAATPGRVIPMTYAVRSDVVEQMEVELGQLDASRARGSGQRDLQIDPVVKMVMSNATHSCPSLPVVQRPIDVAHFWEVDDARNFGRFRQHVSRALQTMSNTTLSDARIMIGTQGARYGTGRNTAQSNYIQALLSSKIVVVSQRDAWEDHYRLMEALSGGAMVLHDTMLTLPRGLENETSIVFFHDVQELERLILHYLEHDTERARIAQAGWQIAMGRHRSWHRVEEVFFGCPLTRVC